MGTTADYRYEHHLIYYKATCATNCSEVGIENAASNSMDILGDAYPNPAYNKAFVNIPLNITAKDAKLTVKNILGQDLISYNNLALGNSNIAINTNNLSSGIYLYTLEAGSNIITKKFSICK